MVLAAKRAAKRYLKRVPWSGWGMLVLAAASSYSHVYVGVHYPTGDLAGVVGLWVACGWIEARCVVGTGNRLGDRAVGGETGSTREEVPDSTIPL